MSCRFNGNRIDAMERYTHNRACAPAAPDRFECLGDTMTYTTFSWETVKATLRRAPTGAPQSAPPSTARSDDPATPGSAAEPVGPGPAPSGGTTRPSRTGCACGVVGR
jgi:hypothetical protein